MSTDAATTGVATTSPLVPPFANPYGHPQPEDRYTPPRTCSRSGEQIVLAYRTNGDPSNPCMLLIPGLSCTCYLYEDPFVDHLVAAGFFVVRMDPRDAGLSTHLTSHAPPMIARMILPGWLSVGEGQPPYLMDDLAEDSFHVLDTLNIPRAHLLGQSMGGMIVQAMAIQRPERTLSLNVVFSHTGGKVWPQTLSMALSFLRSPKSHSVEDLVSFKMWQSSLFCGGYPFPDTPERRAQATAELARAHESSRATIRQMWCIQRSPSREPDLQKLRTLPRRFPITIFHGLVDTMVPKENGFRLAEMMPEAKLVLFPKMGHWMPPALFTDFVKELVIAKEMAAHMTSSE